MFNPPAGAVPYIIASQMIYRYKLETQGYISVVESLGISSTTFTHAPRKLPEFDEITQNNGHYADQSHSKSPILVPIESSYDFLLEINSNLPPILHRFRDIAVDRSKIAILGYPSCV